MFATQIVNIYATHDTTHPMTRIESTPCRLATCRSLDGGRTDGIKTALDVFAGYVMLDVQSFLRSALGPRPAARELPPDPLQRVALGVPNLQ
jgi:hypothetical protein